MSVHDLLIRAVQDVITGRAVPIAYGLRPIERGEPHHDFVLWVRHVGGLFLVGVEAEVESDVGLCTDGVEAGEVKGVWVPGPGRVHGPVCGDCDGGDIGEHDGEVVRVGLDVWE